MPKKTRIKSGFNNYQELNQIIEKSKLDFLNQKEEKPDEKNKIKFIDYSINIIDKQYVKIATKKKFLSSLRFFQRFLKETISKEDIPISELNQGEHKNEDLENEILEVSIGSDIWMVKNLNVERVRNGDLIQKVELNEDWEEAVLNKQPAW